MGFADGQSRLFLCPWILSTFSVTHKKSASSITREEQAAKIGDVSVM